MLVFVLVVSVMCLFVTLVALSYLMSLSSKVDQLLKRVAEIEGYLAVSSGPHREI